MIVDEPEPEEEGIYIYGHKFWHLVLRYLTELSLTMGIDDCLIKEENIEEVMAQMEDFLDTCQLYNTKLKQERREGKVPSKWMDIEASH